MGVGNLFSESHTMTDLHKAAESLLAELGTYFDAYPHMQKGHVIDAITALREALAKPVVPEWKPIETAPKNRVVLVHYKNSLGNGRTMRACYYTYETLESDNTKAAGPMRAGTKNPRHTNT